MLTKYKSKQMKIHDEKGYTLVELLAVIFLLIAVGAIISSILTSVLRSSNKSTNTEMVRANGNYAIGQMSKMIAYAQRLEGISVSDPIQFPNQVQTDCVGQPSSTQYHYLTIKLFNGGITTFACLGTTVASQSAFGTSFLVDPTLNTKTCYFKCTQESAAASPRIDIFLDLTAKSTAVFSESQADIPFETSVVLKNASDR
jgi:type II secretory pathway pseudopilin PulG